VARVPILMPNLGYDMTSGRLASWRKNIGDHVERGEAIAEVETDKTTVEMEATSTGVLVSISHVAGEDVPVGDPIGELETGS